MKIKTFIRQNKNGLRVAVCQFRRSRKNEIILSSGLKLIKN